MGVDRLIRKFRLHLLAWLLRSRSGSISCVRSFSYKDIKRATDGFNRLIYKNSQGAAYKARFRNGVVSLVKEVKAFNEGDDMFYREVQLLGRLHHRHLLELRGFSLGHKRFLVYDNIENGSLKEHLNDPLRTPLNWQTRLQITVGVTAALEYLFRFSDIPVRHVSISSSSIMLDESFTVKLSDVGLHSSSRYHVTVPGYSCSRDYMDQQCDNVIFQLGLLILELITGQSAEKGSTDLVQWIQETGLASSVHKMIDPDLGNSYSSRELRILLGVAKLCIKSRKTPKFSISQIFQYLQRKVDIPHN